MNLVRFDTRFSRDFLHFQNCPFSAAYLPSLQALDLKFLEEQERRNSLEQQQQQSAKTSRPNSKGAAAAPAPPSLGIASEESATKIIPQHNEL